VVTRKVHEMSAAFQVLSQQERHPGGMGANLLQARTSDFPIYRGTMGGISKKKELSRKRGKNLGWGGKEVRATTALSICPQAV